MLNPGIPYKTTSIPIQLQFNFDVQITKIFNMNSSMKDFVLDFTGQPKVPSVVFKVILDDGDSEPSIHPTNATKATW